MGQNNDSYNRGGMMGQAKTIQGTQGIPETQPASTTKTN
jgi:hypothetical protein